MKNIFVRFLLPVNFLMVFWVCSSLAVQDIKLDSASENIVNKPLYLSVNHIIKGAAGNLGGDSIIEIDANNSLRVTDIKIMGLKKIYHLAQYYKGVSVDGVTVSLVASDNASPRILGSYIEGIDREVEDFEQPDTFQLIDLKEWIKTSYYQQADSEITIEEYADQAVIILNGDKGAQLAYKAIFKLITKNSLSITRPVIYVDPYTKEIIKQSERTLYDRAAGSGPGGNPKIGEHVYDFVSSVAGKTAKSANTFIVTPNERKVKGECKSWDIAELFCDDDYYVLDGTCSMDADGVQTINLAGATSGDAIHTYGCDNTSNTGNQNDMSTFTENNSIEGYTPINDAHFNGQLVYEMYQSFSNSNNSVLASGSFKKGLASGPFKGGLIKLRVHYDEFSDNASWDGTYVNLGDGYDEFYPMVSLDVISHEVAHGFMEKHNADYLYVDNSPSASIAESFSDIAGEAAEYFHVGSNDWLHNQPGYRGTPEEAGRYFADPTLDGNSIASLRDYWTGLTTRYGSGLFNKAFYHLVNDNAEWNTLSAYQLFMVAATNYWKGNTDFVTAAQGVVWAVEDLDTSKFNGATTSELQAQVVTAFSQVDIYTASVDENYALLDYEINFSSLSLINRSGTKGNTTNWQWRISGEDVVYEKTINMEQGKEVNQLISNLEDGIYQVTLSFIGNDQQDYQYSKTVKIGADYCAANVGSSITGYISQVSIDGQTITAQTGADNYADYSEFSPFQLASTTASITLTPSDSRYNHSWSVWIDNNGDGDFLDDGEWLLKGHSSKEAVTENITIPNDSNVLKRLRVAQNYSGYPRPRCQYIASGEVEDYSIVLNEAPPVIEVNIVTTVDSENSMTYSFQSDTRNIDTINSYEWAIKDSENNIVGSFYSSDPDHTFSHTFTNSGNYTVFLVVNSEYDASKYINVIDDEAEQEYCQPVIENPGNVYIDRSFIWETNSSGYRTIYSDGNGFGETGYQFNSNEFDGVVNHGGAPLRKGIDNTYYFELSEPVVNDELMRYWKVWIDANTNNIFEDDELIIDESNNNGLLYFYPYSTPDSYPSGDTRMRIRVSDSANIGVCDDSNSGEVEDYLIRIE